MRKQLIGLSLALLSAVAWALPSVADVEAQVQQGHYTQAETMMKEVVDAKPASAKGHYVYAELLAHNGNFARASEEAAKARQLDPDIKFAAPEKFRAFEDLLKREQSPRPRAETSSPSLSQLAPANVEAPRAAAGLPRLGLGRRPRGDRAAAVARFLAQPGRSTAGGVELRQPDGRQPVRHAQHAGEPVRRRCTWRPGRRRRPAADRCGRGRWRRGRNAGGRTAASARRQRHALRLAAGQHVQQPAARQRRRQRAREPQRRLRQRRRLGMPAAAVRTAVAAAAATTRAAAGIDPLRRPGRSGWSTISTVMSTLGRPKGSSLQRSGRVVQ